MSILVDHQTKQAMANHIQEPAMHSNPMIEDFEEIR